MGQIRRHILSDEQALAAARCLWDSYVTPASNSVYTKLPTTSPSKIAKSTTTCEKSASQKTILYLAYGSNLSAETFKGFRGIKPLSAVNVHVPTLDLTFDLPGIPYNEPCFANTRYRKSTHSNPDKPNDKWDKGLIGVVYEVTPEDYSTIIATEGGGASYQDVLVQCYVVPPGAKVVDPSPGDTPFEAHTLLAPEGNNNRGKPVTPPDSSRAPQASARYLKLIRDGAEEHDLPAEYIAYLYNLQPYMITTYRQTVGRLLILATWLPIILFLILLGKIVADKDGKSPQWVVKIQGIIFRTLWLSYDNVLKPAFGDGESSMGEEEFRNILFADWIS